MSWVPMTIRGAHMSPVCVSTAEWSHREDASSQGSRLTCWNDRKRDIPSSWNRTAGIPFRNGPTRLTSSMAQPTVVSRERSTSCPCTARPETMSAPGHGSRSRSDVLPNLLPPLVTNWITVFPVQSVRLRKPTTGIDIVSHQFGIPRGVVEDRVYPILLHAVRLHDVYAR